MDSIVALFARSIKNDSEVHEVSAEVTAGPRIGDPDFL